MYEFPLMECYEFFRARKRWAIEALLMGRSVNEVAATFGFTIEQLFDWIGYDKEYAVAAALRLRCLNRGDDSPFDDDEEYWEAWTPQ